MCMACGHPQAPGHWTEAGAQTPGARLRARLRVAEMLGRLLRPFGLTVHDTHPVPGWRLADRTGRVVLVETLDQLWAEAARLTGRPVDPLDPVFLDG